MLQCSTVQYLQCYILSFRNCLQQQRTTDRQQLEITIEKSTINKQDKISTPTQSQQTGQRQLKKPVSSQ